MKYTIKARGSFNRSLKRCLKRGFDEEILLEAIAILAETGTLPRKYKPHPLRGKYTGCMECHLQPDCLLIWQQNDRELILLLIEIGTHSDLF